MKKVIPNNNQNTVNIEFINNESIIGFQNNSYKFFLLKKEGKYIAVGESNFNLSGAEYPNVRNCASQGHSECFLFDNHKELFKWLSE